MNEKTFTLEAIKEQFCVTDKQETLEKMRQDLDDALDIDDAAELTAFIGEYMEKQIEENDLTWTPMERFLWAVKEAFILGSLDMAKKFMEVADMGIEALAKEG